MLVLLQHNEYPYCCYCHVLCTLTVKINHTRYDVVQRQPQQNSSNISGNNSRQDPRPTFGNSVLPGYY